ncbi:MAG: DoxX family protein [Gemmataceae bacterium]
MTAGIQTAYASKVALWSGRVISYLAALFLLWDGIMKLFRPEFVVEATVRLGYGETAIIPLGIVLIICTSLYLIPLTEVLGAILLTGYLGGAVASHLRAGDPTFSIFFPAIFGAPVWGGLYLRDTRLRLLFLNGS